MHISIWHKFYKNLRQINFSSIFYPGTLYRAFILEAYSLSADTFLKIQITNKPRGSNNYLKNYLIPNNLAHKADKISTI